MTPKNVAIVWAPNLLRAKNLETGGVSISASKGYKIKFVGYIKSGGELWEQTPKKPKSRMKLKDAEQLTFATRGNREFFIEFVGPRGEKTETELFVSLLPVEYGKPPRSLVAGYFVSAADEF